MELRSVAFRVLLSVLAVSSLIYGIHDSANADLNLEVADGAGSFNGFGGPANWQEAFEVQAVWLIIAAVLAFMATLTLAAGVALWGRPIIAGAGAALFGLFWMTHHVSAYVFSDTLGFEDAHTYYGMQMGVGIAIFLGSIALALRIPVARVAAAVLAVAAFVFMLIAGVELADLSEDMETTVASLFLLAFAFLAFGAWLGASLLEQKWTTGVLAGAALIFAAAFILSATGTFVDEEPQKHLDEAQDQQKVMLQSMIAGAAFEYVMAVAWLFIMVAAVMPFLGRIDWGERGTPDFD